MELKKISLSGCKKKKCETFAQLLLGIFHHLLEGHPYRLLSNKFTESREEHTAPVSMLKVFGPSQRREHSGGSTAEGGLGTAEGGLRHSRNKACMNLLCDQRTLHVSLCTFSLRPHWLLQDGLNTVPPHPTGNGQLPSPLLSCLTESLGVSPRSCSPDGGLLAQAAQTRSRSLPKPAETDCSGLSAGAW